MQSQPTPLEVVSNLAEESPPGSGLEGLLEPRLFKEFHDIVMNVLTFRVLG